MTPYTTAKTRTKAAEPGNPFNDGRQSNAAFGTDFKLGLGSNLTLDATMNPDFGQVEVDPAVVNLSDVESFFDEKRPFFIEGSDTFGFGFGGASNNMSFNFSNPNIFYSRRIGRTPQGSPVCSPGTGQPSRTIGVSKAASSSIRKPSPPPRPGAASPCCDRSPGAGTSV